MNSLILRTTTKLLFPLLLLLSLFLLYRGHNEPGGGFVGGLIASAALALYAIAADVESARRALRVAPQWLIGCGLLTAAASGAAGPAAGKQFLAGLWIKASAPGMQGEHIGTPLLFDVGVYLVVIGFTLTVIFALLEE